MIVIIQRVKEATVKIEEKNTASIKNGLLLLLGIGKTDDEEDIDWLCKKIVQMRIFTDNEGKMNLSVLDIGGEVLIVSQFTLLASTKKGNRPSFTEAAPPLEAKILYEKFIDKFSTYLPKKVATGEFGADMQIQLINDGPVTIPIDSKNKV